MNLIAIAIAWLLALPTALSISNTTSYGRSVNYPPMNVSENNDQTKRDANLLGFGVRKPWPLMNWGAAGQLRTITYCYATLEMRAVMDCQFQQGIKIWSDALGGPASPATGHSVAFHEMKAPDGSPAPCFTSWDNTAHTGQWDPRIPPDTLKVWGIDEMVATSTVGYIDDSQDAGRHDIKLKLNLPTDQTYIIAHELGHVLGMIHEHQRYDRDDYVQFNCHNVKNFYVSVTAARLGGLSEEEATRKLCTEPNFANRFGFGSIDFMKGYSWNGHHYNVAYDYDYDPQSIMHYHSWVYALEDACTNDVDACPLVRRVVQNGVTTGVNYIYPRTSPSAVDVSFVRKYYPWYGYAQSGPARARARKVGRANVDATIFNKIIKADGTASYLFRTRIGGVGLAAL